MPEAREHPALQALRLRVEQEEAAYAAALAELDRCAAVVSQGPPLDVAVDLEALEDLARDPQPADSGLLAALRRLVLGRSPRLERARRFQAALVRLLGVQLARQAAHEADLRRLTAALVSYAQRVEPVMDARDQARVARAPSEATLLIADIERRVESLRNRVEGLLAQRERIELLSEQLRALRAALAGPRAGPPQAGAAAARTADAAADAAVRAADDAVYTAFENCFRGSRERIRGQQAGYVELLRAHEPVVDLGCGRGELLVALREAGIRARGVEGNANAVRECREQGLDVVAGDLVAFLGAQDAGTLGAVFAAQVIEHLPPSALVALLAQAHRALRADGLLVLETVNAASALAFHDVFIRDPTHERPLHPDTLRFLAAAAGFSDVRIELRSPVPEDVRLRTAPSGTLAPPLAQVFNENVARLNELLFAPLDYALVARR